MNNWKEFFKADEMHKKEVVEGDVTRHVYTGKHIQIVEYYFPPNKTFPVHKHELVEQMGFLVKGRMGFRVNGIEQDLNPGDWYHAAIGVDHNAWTYEEPSILVDIFSPPREDLM